MNRPWMNLPVRYSSTTKFSSTRVVPFAHSKFNSCFPSENIRSKFKFTVIVVTLGTVSGYGCIRSYRYLL